MDYSITQYIPKKFYFQLITNGKSGNKKKLPQELCHTDLVLTESR